MTNGVHLHVISQISFKAQMSCIMSKYSINTEISKNTLSRSNLTMSSKKPKMDYLLPESLEVTEDRFPMVKKYHQSPETAPEKLARISLYLNGVVL